MADFGVMRRPKRVRSTSMTANNELDAELQSSIRSQSIGNAPKKSRVSYGGGRSFSSSFTLSRTPKVAEPVIEPGHVKPVESSTPAINPAWERFIAEPTSRIPQAAIHKDVQGPIKSLWSSMSGFFGRDKRQPSVRTMFDGHESLQNAFQRPDSDSPRDSGIYIDSRPSSLLKPESSNGSRPSSRLKADGNEDFNQNLLEPSLTLEPPKVLVSRPSESPLKRLQTASMSGLRRVKSLALRPQPSREDMQKEQYQALMLKMSSLQDQLNECKQEFTQLFGDNAKQDTSVSHTAAKLSVSPKSDRGTQTIIDLYTDRGESNSPLRRANQDFHISIESPAEQIERVYPADWPLRSEPVVTDANNGPSLRRVPTSRVLRTPEPAASAEAEAVGSAAILTESVLPEHVTGDVEFLRRSLSTIPSSGDEESPEAKRTNVTSPLGLGRSRAVTGDIRQGQGSDLPRHKIVKSAKDGIAASRIESPRTLRALGRRQDLPTGKISKAYASPKRKKSSKKVIDSENAGHYDESGQWVWGSDAF